MKNSWPRKALGEICKFVRGPFGGSLKKSVFVNNGFAVYEQQHAIHNQFEEIRYFINDKKFKEMQRFELHPSDLIMSCSGTMGRVAIVPENIHRGIINQALLKLTPSSAASSEFLKYWMDSNDFQERLKEQAGGAAIQNVASVSILKEIQIPLPPPSEQQRIVGILDQAFAAIATAKANAEKNLQNARALFESHLNDVFTNRGDGWMEKMLGDKSLIGIIDGDRGKNYPKASDFNDEGHCLFLNTKNVRPDGFDFGSTMFITEEKDEQLRKGKLQRDDVVLTTRGTIGNVGLYSEDVPFQHIRINSGMLILSPNRRALLPLYLFQLFRSEIVKDQIRMQTTGAAQPQLPIKTLVNFRVPVPTNLEDQRATVNKIRAFEPETSRLESIYQRKIAALEELKKSLLHDAFRGAL